MPPPVVGMPLAPQSDTLRVRRTPEVIPVPPLGQPFLLARMLARLPALVLGAVSLPPTVPGVGHEQLLAVAATDTTAALDDSHGGSWVEGVLSLSEEKPRIYHQNICWKRRQGGRRGEIERENPRS